MNPRTPLESTLREMSDQALSDALDKTAAKLAVYQQERLRRLRAGHAEEEVTHGTIGNQ